MWDMYHVSTVKICIQLLCPTKKVSRNFQFVVGNVGLMLEILSHALQIIPRDRTRIKES